MKQHRRIKFILLGAALTLLSPGFSQAETSEGDAWVKGVTEFLLDRANDNYMYIFERKLASNPFLKKYLPETLRVAQAGDLRSLLTHKELWKVALKKDFAGDKLLTTVLDDLEGFRERLCTGPEKKPLEELKVSCTTAKTIILEAKNKSDKSRGAPSISGEGTKRDIVELKSIGKETALTHLVQNIGQVKTAACNDLIPGRYTGCAIEIIALLDAAAHADYVVNCYLYGNWCSNNERKFGIREEDDDFSDFRRYALFFAQIVDAADSKDPNTTKALLKSVTVPPVSFGIKREPHRTRVLITSYVGGAWARPTSSASDQRSFVVAAPIGVEISQARGSGNSLSLLLSPIDFGYPLSLKLNGSDARVRASDVFVPGAYLLSGLKNYPLAWGVGYSRVRSVDNPDKREGRLMILIAFDMPLFKLH